MRPRSGKERLVRHMKSWSSSSAEGALNANTCVPCGFTPDITCSMVLSLPAASMAWNMSSTAQRSWAKRRSCSSRSRATPWKSRVWPCSLDSNLPVSPGSWSFSRNPAPSTIRYRLIPMASPHADAVRRRQVEGLAGLDVEGLVPVVEVAHGVRAVLVGRVAVAEDLLAQGRLARLRPPRLREADEELLVAGKRLDERRRLAAQGQPVRVVGRGQPRHVGDVLAEGLLPVHRDVGERLVGVELLHQPRRGGLEVGPVLVRPPVLEAAGIVEQGARVVEAVADLVADDGADRAVVHDHRPPGIEIRRLQD